MASATRPLLPRSVLPPPSTPPPPPLALTTTTPDQTTKTTSWTTPSSSSPLLLPSSSSSMSLLQGSSNKPYQHLETLTPPPSSSSSLRYRSDLGPSDTHIAADSSHLPASHPSYSSFTTTSYHGSPSSAQDEEYSLPARTIRARAFSSLSTSSTSSSPVKRKALPANISPLALRYSSGQHLASTIEEQPESPFVRPFSGDSPTLYECPDRSSKAFTPASHSPNNSLSTSNDELGAWTTKPSTLPTTTPDALGISNLIPFDSQSTLEVTAATNHPSSPATKHAPLTIDSPLLTGSTDSSAWYSESTATTPLQSTMSIFSTKATPPHNLEPSRTVTRSFSHDSYDSSHDSYDSNITIQKAPKSPGASKLGSFFGWGGSASPPSSSTSFSGVSISPIPSPQPSDDCLPPANASRSALARSKPSAIDIPKANADVGGYFGTAHLQVPLATPTTPIQVEEMEKELKDISADLAASIRREMDLEDLVERLQSEAQNPSGNNGRRTSDYFSDAGTSSVKVGESDSRQDELDRLVRRTEQEKAQMRLELTDKIQDERQKRKFFESQVRKLEEKASQVDIAAINSMSASGRLKDLEATCEDLRRRLTEERQVKDNFEDLLTVLRGELQTSHNERDNLRDEIVPQLRARVEGLEAQAAEHEKHIYEQSKMQQELQTLKKENRSLLSTQRSQVDPQQLRKFNTIVEEVGSSPEKKSFGLSRSNSVAAHGSSTRSRPPSLSRSLSVKTPETREVLVERVKDVEAQRDALHRALKSLLERQEYQNRENQKRIRQLEMERDRALSSSPRRLGYDKEVSGLRNEINTLRRRADEAIEQKWQCEKGLSGLKMDLDRAEEEISSLRSLLQENDILVPFERRPSIGSRPGSAHATSESLEKAYKDLQKAYVESLERIKKLESSGPKDEETLQAVQQLEKSLADALSERDFAQREASFLRGQTESLRGAEKTRMTDEVALADELRDSAKRVEELATQVRQQLASNAALRQRLAETIQRGEEEQRANSEKILHLQTRLKSLEDRLMAAQQASEDKVAQHEDELRDLRESHSLQLQRVKDGLRSPRVFGPNSPMTPMLANSPKAPRLLSTSSGAAMTVSEDSKMEFLKQRVMELESALADADKEMEEVVSRMNVAQIEVMELQNEREGAVRETRRLQKLIEEERLRAFQTKFATLSS